MMPYSRALPALVVLALAVAFPSPCRADEKVKPNAKPVTVKEDKTSFTLSNGIVTARVSKRSGDLTSLQYQGMEVLTDQSGHPGAYWSHDTTGGKETLTKNTRDQHYNSQE